MRVLCVSAVFAPMRDSEAFCGGKMVLALQERGLDVSVIYMDEARLTSRHDPSRHWEGLRSISVPVSPDANCRQAGAAVRAIRYQTLAWPRWVGNVLEVAADLHQRSAFDILYTRSLPIAGHIAGYWLARRLRLPWLANINDPWDYHLFPGAGQHRKPRLQVLNSNFWFARTLRCADAVSFPCRRLAAYTLRLAGSKRSVEVIPHIGTACASPISHNGFCLVHAGKLGSNEVTGRSSRALLEALRRFLNEEPAARETVSLMLIGPEDPQTSALVAKLGLQSNVRAVGPVSYEESLQWIGCASACVLIEAQLREGVFLPSKLADYLAARKPILALSPREGTVSDMSSDQGVLRVDQEDEVAIASVLRRLYEAYQRGSCSAFAPSSGLVKHFNAEVVASQFVSLASELLERKRACTVRNESLAI